MFLKLAIFFLTFSTFIFKAHTLYASYAPISPAGITVEESLKDKSLVKLAYSNPLYDNVGTLSARNASGQESLLGNEFTKGPAVVYIGRKTCLTAAHCYEGDGLSYDVGFEISGRDMQYYHVVHFITHPKHKENYHYDIAVLILDQEVEGLDGLVPNYEFSKPYKYIDYKHLLTYVGYGAEISDNNWFEMPLDGKRRAQQAYVNYCCMEPKRPGLYSTPSGYYNRFREGASIIPYKGRPVIHYEARSRQGMSGGAALHTEKGFVGIIFGHQGPCRWPFHINAYLCVSFCIRFCIEFIEIFCCPIFLLRPNTSIISHGVCIYSVPLGAVKDFIEECREEFDNTIL